MPDMDPSDFYEINDLIWEGDATIKITGISNHDFQRIMRLLTDIYPQKVKAEHTQKSKTIWTYPGPYA